MDKLICGICPTYNRPELLGRAIRAFEKQTYENRVLIIVDDTGQYNNQSGDRWQLISLPNRVMSLGEKNNICASLAPKETWAYAKWDDDDIYMPWHLEALSEALTRGPFVQPRLVVDFWDGRWVLVESFGRRKERVRYARTRAYKAMPNKTFCYHGSWGYTRELFAEVGGYGCCYAGDDCEFQHRLMMRRVVSVDVNQKRFRPSYFYNRPLQNRISELGSTGEVYWNKGNEKIQFIGEVPKWTDESVWDIEIPTEIIPRPW